MEAGGINDSGVQPSDSGVMDTATADGPGGCAAISAGATDVYVDQRFTGTPRTGAAACPLSTILQGIAAAASLTGTVTIHVAGSTPSLAYSETSAVSVAANMVVQGGGPATTTINASGPCGTLTCGVLVAGGGILDGFTVVSATGDGVVTAASSPAPIVRNVAASGSKANGIVALGAVELGPNIAASNNGANGVESPTTASGRLHVIGTSNSFDNNVAGNGINVDGSATLDFEGGTASGNFQGIRLAGATPGGAHTITSLTATNNKGPGGVVAYSGQTIKMRSSTLVGNTAAGLFYNYLNGSTLDIGSGPTDPGGNRFGSATAASRNGKAGLSLCNASGAATLPAYGNLWSTCPPTQTFIACGAALSSYTDVAYAPTSTPGPVVATTCTTGP